MDWRLIEDSLDTLHPVSGGFSQAKRGIVTLPDGSKLFVKLAVDEKTRQWIDLELKAYHWLQLHDYKYAPRLVAESKEGFALPDLSAWDWQDSWTESKIDAALEALRELAALSSQAGDFLVDEAHMGDDPWIGLSLDVAQYSHLVDGETANKLAELLSDRQQIAKHRVMSATEPWRGQELAHYDVRADNFAYNPEAGEGLLVDWNWLCYGSPAFDRTTLLVNVQLSGFEVLPHYKDQLDAASLAWLTGFWLKNSLGSQETEGLKRLRPRQVANAVVALRLAERL